VRKGLLGVLEARRIQMLSLLHKDWDITATTDAVDSHRREKNVLGGGLLRADFPARSRMIPVID
jgi:hypothetical protein